LRRLGFDPGTSRIGVSEHDDDEVPARPFATLEVGKASAMALIAALVTKERPDEVVIGLPLNMDGTDGPSARSARRLAANVAKHTGIRVILWDERLTTTQAQRARIARGTKGRKGIDAEAATILLQSYVDSKRGGSQWEPDDS
jgi:putative holliday junction resolvase